MPKAQRRRRLQRKTGRYEALKIDSYRSPAAWF
jgi:hypothetical protein